MAFGKGDEKEGSNSFTAMKSSGEPGKIEAFLGQGSKVVGNLSFTGPVEINGYVEGEIVAQDRLTIGESAVLNAKITGAEIVVRGTVNGDITATKLLTLKKPAKIVGNIASTNLSIEEGVIFEGKCSMNTSGASQVKGSPVKSVTPDRVGASA